MNNILYHIIVFNNNIKEKIISKFNNIIDMDIINKNVEREYTDIKILIFLCNNVGN